MKKNSVLLRIIYLICIILTQNNCSKQNNDDCDYILRNINMAFFCDTISIDKISNLKCFEEGIWGIPTHTDNNRLHNVKFVINKLDTTLMLIYSHSGEHRISYLEINNYDYSIEIAKNNYIDNYLDQREYLIRDTLPKSSNTFGSYSNSRYLIQIVIQKNKKLSIMKVRL